MTISDKIFIIVLAVIASALVLILVLQNKSLNKCVSDVNEIKSTLQYLQFDELETERINQ